MRRCRCVVQTIRGKGLQRLSKRECDVGAGGGGGGVQRRSSSSLLHENATLVTKYGGTSTCRVAILGHAFRRQQASGQLFHAAFATATARARGRLRGTQKKGSDRSAMPCPEQTVSDALGARGHRQLVQQRVLDFAPRSIPFDADPSQARTPAHTPARPQVRNSTFCSLLQPAPRWSWSSGSPQAGQLPLRGAVGRCCTMQCVSKITLRARTRAETPSSTRSRSASPCGD